MEDSLCAMTSTVIFPIFYLYASIDSLIIFSFILSRAEVASSSRIIRGFLMKALAIAILYF